MENIKSMYDFICICCDKFENEPFCFDHVNGEYRKFLYRDFRKKVLELAAGLIKKNITGKHIALFSRNRFECYVIYCASVLSGNVFIPINIDIPEEQQKSLTEFADTDIAIFSPDLAEGAEAILRNNSRVTDVFVIDSPEYTALSTEDYADTEFYGDLEDDRTVLMGFTSGSQGIPKAVMMSVKCVMTPVTHDVYKTYASADCLDILEPIPMYHIAALNTLFNIVPLGHFFYLCEKPGDVFRDINVYKPYYAIIVPAIAEVMLKIMQADVDEKGKRDEFEEFCRDKTKTLKQRSEYCAEFKGKLGGNFSYASIVGARLSEEMTLALNNFGIEIRSEYGMTECAQVTCMSENVVPGSVGKLAPHNTAEIVDGILYIKGDNVMKGYYKNPEMTKQILSEDGWLCTGDMARIDDEGNVFILGRKDNTIVLKDGENINASAIENELLKIDMIEEAIVIADKKRDNESVGALIYAKGGKTDEETKKLIGEAIKAVNRSLPIRGRVLRFRLTESPFKKNSMMKIKRAEYINEEI